MTLLLYVQRLAHHRGVCWVVSDSKSTMGTLGTYQGGGHCGEGRHHHYAQSLGVERLAPRAAINIVVTPSQWMTPINVQVVDFKEAVLSFVVGQPDLLRLGQFLSDELHSHVAWFREPHMRLPHGRRRDGC